MLFEILFTIPVGYSTWSDNSPRRHLPTIYIDAPTAQDARRRANDFIVALPPGSTFKINDVNGLLNEGMTQVDPGPGAPALLDAVNHVLIAAEDGGDMNDIDWDFLRSAVKGATESESVPVLSQS